jgi:exosortase A
MAALLLVFHRTILDMVGLWNLYASYTHAWLVPPIVAWMVWRRRHRLAATPRKPEPWMLLPILAALMVWLAGELLAMNAPAQLAFVAIVAMSVPMLFGFAVAREIAFPLAFMFFAVPVGEAMTAPMMDWTADFTIAALQFSGVPVYREGLNFVIPSGQWSVVEACSGVRYLMASFMVGTLYAYLNYRSTRRRVLFSVFAFFVPIVANWVRAYLIVMMGHLSDNKIAAGVDHILYGWLFFGIVVGLMYWVGARWAEAGEALESAAQAANSGAALRGPLPVVAMIALLGVAVASQGLLSRLGQPSTLAEPKLRLPQLSAWKVEQDVPAPSQWAPHWLNPNQRREARYTAADGTAVHAWLAFYRDQNERRKLVTSVHDIVPPGENKEWVIVESGRTTIAGSPWRIATLQPAGTMGSSLAQRIQLVQAYWIGGRWTADPFEARWRLALNRLMGRGDDSAVLVLYRPPAVAGIEAPSPAPLVDLAEAAMPALDRGLRGGEAAASP